MLEFWKIFGLICPLVFFAGFIDAVAGGGGIISLPAYLMAGVPVHFAAGTNKVVNCIGTSVAAGKYLRSGKVRLKAALWAAAGALAGASIGTRLALLCSEKTLQMIITIALPVTAVFLTFRKDFGETGKAREYSPRKEALFSAAIGLGIGCYDGLIGPGTGTFMIMAFTAVLGLDLLTASGCAKVGNLASNVASAVVFILNGKVLWSVVLPAVLCNVLGNYVGARYAIRGGSKKVRGVMFAVLGLLFAKTFLELLK